jgi:hypothetical protein
MSSETAMIIDPRDYFGPEYDLAAQGDPFLATIVQADDLIGDHWSNYEWLGESEAEGHAIADQIAQQQLSFELETLYRWYGR